MTRGGIACVFLFESLFRFTIFSRVCLLLRISQGASPPAPLRSKRCWAWVQWSANVRIAAESVGADGVAHIVCKAVDDQYNVQVCICVWHT